MTKQRINIKDVISDEFYQLPKLFFWDKQYREETSPGAKLLYMLVKDRFSLSLYTTKQENNNENTPTYTDENGDIYCILDNQEIEFTLNTTTKTVIKWMNELEALMLVDTEETEGGANRIYLNKLDSSGATLATFLGQRDFYKHVKSRKKKKKEPTKTEEQCIEEWEKKFKKSYPQNKGRGGKNTPLGDGEVPALGDGEIPPLGDGDCPPPGVEEVQPNNNYALDLDPNQNYPNQNNDNNTESSSNDSEEPQVLEEELSQSTMITVFNNYGLLNELNILKDICKDLRAINVVKKALMESKIESFYLVDLTNAIGSHAKNVQVQLNKGEKIRYEPAFFANNLVDTIRANEVDRRLKLERKAKNRRSFNSTVANDVPLYNWIEE